MTFRKKTNDKFLRLFLFSGDGDAGEFEFTLRHVGYYDLAHYLGFILENPKFQKLGGDRLQSRYPHEAKPGCDLDRNLFFWVFRVLGQEIPFGFYQFCNVIGWEG